MIRFRRDRATEAIMAAREYLAYQHSIIARQHRQARALFVRVFGSIHLPPPLLTAPRFFIV